MMLNWALVLLLGLLAVANCQNSGKITKIRSKYAFIADKGLISQFAHDCIDNSNKYKYQVKESPSIETLINLVERLEDVVANTSEYSQFSSPDKVARMILHRFHMDSVNFNTVEQDPHVERAASVDSRIIGLLPNVVDYNFPDYVYTDQELCTMLFMFSHIFLNNTYESTVARGKRATYPFQKSAQAPVQSDFVGGSASRDTSNVNPIQEKGVVSFRQDKSEAIAPARVFIGIIAGLTDNPVLSGKIITKAAVGNEITNEVTLKDGLLAVTFGNLMGTASFFEIKNTANDYDQNLVFGVKGTWVNETCCTYYATDGVSDGRLLRKSNRGSLAQIRGSLDGYIIGKNLKSLGTTQLRLSSILKSYYSAPHVTTSSYKFGISYCDRNTNKPTTSELNDIGISYNAIYNFIYSRDNSIYRGDILTNQLNQAVNTQQEFCNKRPSGNLDKSSPCETPSDLIFVVDPKSEEMSKSAQLISDVVSRINKIDRYGGSVSVFVNSNQRLTAELPTGPGGWPLSTLVFNSTNIGSVVCQLSPEAPLGAQTSMGKYLLNVNQTIMNYKWWTPRRFYAGVPSKNIILIDYGTLVMPTSGTEKDDYYTYRDSLKWRNRDVEYLVVSPNQQLFKDFVREEANIVTSSQSTQTGATFAAKICENPATLTYNECERTASQNVSYEGYVTPGYKQNWAMYPEYFKVSSSIEFKIKAMEGSIKYCYDRYFPPERAENCKELQENAEESFKIWGPCSGQSVHTCNPIYITVWGKERSTICKDDRCLSLDQAKFSIGHTGAFCNSAIKLGSVLLLQAICFILVWMHSFKSV